MTKVLIAGGSGLVGKELTKLLLSESYGVAWLSRRPSDRFVKQFYWDPERGQIDPEAIEYAQIIVNLSGANVAARWTERYKKKITDSRVKSNELLLKLCQQTGVFPEAYISSGGMNYYGDQAGRILSESDPPGEKGFLPKSCLLWEKAVSHWQNFGVRTVQFRMSIVLSSQGGALPKMLLPLPLGILPVFGRGDQWYSWIHIIDMCALLGFAVKNQQMRGTYNAASPNPLPLSKFLRKAALGLGKNPLLLPIPQKIVSLLLGDMGETVLSSVRLSVDKLKQAGFQWSYPELPAAVADLYRHKY